LLAAEHVPALALQRSLEDRVPMALRGRRSSSLGACDGPTSFAAGQTGDSELGGSGRERRMPLLGELGRPSIPVLAGSGHPAARRAGHKTTQLSLFLSTAAAPRWFYAVSLSRSISRGSVDSGLEPVSPARGCLRRQWCLGTPSQVFALFPPVNARSATTREAAFLHCHPRLRGAKSRAGVVPVWSQMYGPSHIRGAATEEVDHARR
jgi:hypothetical protein